MMGTKLLLLNLSFVVVIALGQDTLPQETHVSSKNKLAASYAANFSRLEERFTLRLRESERRMVHRFEDRFRVLNQTIAINHLENFVQHFMEELELAKEAEQEQNDVIRHLKMQNSHKQHELRRLRTSLERLRFTVASLNELVEELVQSKKDEGKDKTEVPTESISAVTKTTTVPFKPFFPTDCQYVYQSGGMKYPGLYYIMIQPDNSPDPFKVCCKMTNNSGWTLLQRRQDGTVDFFRNWDNYKKGFGSLEGEFWLGNDHIYRLTNQGDYKLRIEMTDWGNRNYWAEYEHFRIDNEDRNYRLHVHGYSGNAGDSMTSKWQGHDNMPFSTRDKDNDERFYDNCAEHYQGAWWFKSCFDSHLNGIYYQKGSHNNYFVRNGVQWNTIHLHSSLKSVVMMVKPNPGAHNDDIPNGIK